MIELSPDDAAVILRQAAAQSLDYLPIAQLNDEGQTEIVRWIESVGKQDDMLTPYAWYSLAEEAAASHDPDDPIVIEMLPTYTESGDYETLELCRLTHFDWSIEAVPVDYIRNPEKLLDTGAPVRFLLMAEAAATAFTEDVCEAYPELTPSAAQLLAGAINLFFTRLCKSVGIMLPNPGASPAKAGKALPNAEDAQWQTAVTKGMAAAEDVMLSLDPELSMTPSTVRELFDVQDIPLASLLPSMQSKAHLTSDT